MRGWAYICLTIAIWGVAGLGCLWVLTGFTQALGLSLVAVIIAVGAVLWSVPSIVYWGQRSNESLIEAIGAPPVGHATTVPAKHVLATGAFAASANAVGIPPAAEAREHLRMERFLREARFPSAASERNARTWLGYLHVTYPYLTAKLPPDADAQLSPIKAEVRAESLAQLRSEVKDYMTRIRLDFVQEPGWEDQPTSVEPPDLPSRSDSGLPRIMLRTTREVRDSAGTTVPAGTDCLFVWLPPTSANGLELVEVRIGGNTKTLPLDSVIAIGPPGHAEMWNRDRAGVLGMDRAPDVEVTESPPPAVPKPGQFPGANVPTPAAAATAPRPSKGLAPQGRLLFEDDIAVEATGHAEFHAALSRGTRVSGFAREVAGLPFDFYIMDQQNYARFCEDRGSREIYAESDRVALDFSRTIPKDGIWYFVFDTYGKQADREIHFELREVPHD